TVEARASVAGSPLVFTATATAGAPTQLLLTSGDAQTGLSGQLLAAPFVVTVKDTYGNPAPAVTVTFAITSGGMTLSATSPMTNVNGQAQSTLTPDGGPNVVTATVNGLTATFHATGNCPPCALYALEPSIANTGDTVTLEGMFGGTTVVTFPGGAAATP